MSRLWTWVTKLMLTSRRLMSLLGTRTSLWGTCQAVLPPTQPGTPAGRRTPPGITYARLNCFGPLPLEAMG